jgi:hypothetical protein
MPAFIVQIVRTGGQSFIEGRDCVLVNAASEADARAAAKNVILGSGYSSEAWDAATVTEIAAAADLEGFRLRVAILEADIDVIVTGAAAATIDDLGTAAAAALNALPEIAGATYNTGTNVLTVCDAADDLSAFALTVELLPPISALYSTPTTPIASFVTGVTAPPGTNEVQTLTIALIANGQTYTITFSGQTTSAIAKAADAATAQAALIALSNLATGDVVVTGTSVVTGLTLTFGGAYAGVDVPAITAVASDAASAVITTSRIGGALQATLVASTPPQAYNDPGLGL